MKNKKIIITIIVFSFLITVPFLINKGRTEKAPKTKVSTVEKQKKKKDKKKHEEKEEPKIETEPEKTVNEGFSPEEAEEHFNLDNSYREGHRYAVGVNAEQNILVVYEKDGRGKYMVPFKTFVCSAGSAGRETPAGQFYTSDRMKWCYMIDGTYGKYVTRFNGPYLIHSVPYSLKDSGTLICEEYNKLGSQASHGCIRLSAGDAEWIYSNLEPGTAVSIYYSSEPEQVKKPIPVKLDRTSPNHGWDPTDPEENNPWRNKET